MSSVYKHHDAWESVRPSSAGPTNKEKKLYQSTKKQNMKIFKGTLRKPEIKIEVKNWDHSEVIRERKISRDNRIYPINPSKPEPVVYKD